MYGRRKRLTKTGSCRYALVEGILRNRWMKGMVYRGMTTYRQNDSVRTVPSVGGVLAGLLSMLC